MRRFGAWVAIALLTPYLVFYGGGWFGIYVSQIRIVSLILLVAVFGAWAVVAWRHPVWRPRSALSPAIVVILATMAASTLVSRYPRQSVEYLGFAVILAGLYLLLVRILADPFLRPRMGGLAVAFTAVLGGAYAIANISRWIDWWNLVGGIALPPLRPASESLTFGNPSAVLTIVLLFWCSAAALIGIETPARRVLIAALGLLAGFAIFVSGSRSGWFAVGVAIIALGAFWLAGRDRRRQLATWLGTALASMRGRILLGGAAAGSAVLLIGLAPTILRRLGEGGEDLRLNYVLAAMRMFAEAPILGTGPGTWVIQRVRYTYAPETDYYIPHAHNVYAQTLAELGVVGALAGVVLLVLLARLVRDAITDRDPVRRRWGWATAFAVTYFAAHNLLDFYPNMPAILFAAALPVAWLDATSARGRNEEVSAAVVREPSGRPVVSVALAVAVAAALAGYGYSEASALPHAGAVAAYDEGAWARADVLARQAVAGDPAWPPYQFTMGLTAAAVGDDARAVAAFRRVAEMDDLPEAWLDLAAEEALLGNEAAAREALRRAARLGLQRPALAMAIGDLAARLGETDLSSTAFATAIATLPSLAGDPWWQADPVRASRFPAIIEASIALIEPEERWQIALLAGDPDRARSLAPATSAGSGAATPIDVIAAWEGDDDAFGRIVAAGEAHPLDSASLMWAARLELRRGNADAANRYLRWLFIGASAGPEGGRETRVSDRLLIGRTIAGRVADFYGSYTYRRPTPWNPLVPSLVQLTVE